MRLGVPESSTYSEFGLLEMGRPGKLGMEEVCFTVKTRVSEVSSLIKDRGEKGDLAVEVCILEMCPSTERGIAERCITSKMYIGKEAFSV